MGSRDEELGLRICSGRVRRGFLSSSFRTCVSYGSSAGPLLFGFVLVPRCFHVPLKNLHLAVPLNKNSAIELLENDSK